jgi:hypothetical protein
MVKHWTDTHVAWQYVCSGFCCFGDEHTGSNGEYVYGSITITAGRSIALCRMGTPEDMVCAGPHATSRVNCTAY